MGQLSLFLPEGTHEHLALSPRKPNGSYGEKGGGRGATPNAILSSPEGFCVRVGSVVSQFECFFKCES